MVNSLDLRSSAQSISRQLGAWADSLQNSEINGQRYLAEKTRRQEQVTREREEMPAGLRQITSQG